jgi:2-methylcitrate dehydratase PrpD
MNAVQFLSQIALSERLAKDRRSRSDRVTRGKDQGKSLVDRGYDGGEHAQHNQFCLSKKQFLTSKEGKTLVSPTNEMIDFVMRTNFEDLPKEVVHEAKLLILDSIGIALAAMNCEKGRYGIALGRKLGGPPESAILGTDIRVSSGAAAFANGELMNGLDWDAFPLPTHAPPVVIPPLLAIGENIGASGKDVILGVSLGFELSRRLATAIRGEKLIYDSPDGSEVGKIVGTTYAVSVIVCPVVATAAGIGKLMKLDREKVSHTVGLAGHFGPFPQARWKIVPPRAMTKYISSGWASFAVVVAAQLAEMGYTADNTFLDGDLGYWRFFGSDRWNPDTLTENLGKEWRFRSSLEYKGYPCCAFYSVFLECFNKIIEENNLLPGDIDEVRIQSGPWPAPTALTGKVECHIQTQFHPLYLIACAAHRISRSNWQDDDTIENKDIEKFMNRIVLKLENHPDSRKIRIKEPSANLTSVQVLAKGKTFKQEGKYLKLASNHEASRMTTNDLVEKFKGNASKAVSQNRVDKAIKTLLNLEDLKDISELIRLFTP